MTVVLVVLFFLICFFLQFACVNNHILMIIADELACLIVGIFVIVYFYTDLTSLHNKTSPANLVGSISRCRMFICPRKRYLCFIKYCISICKFLKDIFGGQTGDKNSHTKRKKNNKTTSEKPC